MRRQIKAKPAGAQPCGVNSATARRILQSLEHMSSPLAVSTHMHMHHCVLSFSFGAELSCFDKRKLGFPFNRMPGESQHRHHLLCPQ